MAGIEAVNLSKLNTVHSNLTPEERKKRQENVATGVGGAAGLTASATKMASKRGLQAQAVEPTLQHMMQTVQNTTNAVNKNQRAARGLWAQYKANIQIYTQDLLKRLKSLKNSKVLGPIINSPITEKAAKFGGGALAFFVLVTGVNKAVKTGALAFDDLKNQYHEYNA